MIRKSTVARCTTHKNLLPCRLCAEQKARAEDAKKDKEFNKGEEDKKTKETK